MMGEVRVKKHIVFATKGLEYDKLTEDDDSINKNKKNHVDGVNLIKRNTKFSIWIDTGLEKHEIKRIHLVGLRELKKSMY